MAYPAPALLQPNLAEAPSPPPSGSKVFVHSWGPGIRTVFSFSGPLPPSLPALQFGIPAHPCGGCCGHRALTRLSMLAAIVLARPNFRGDGICGSVAAQNGTGP